MFSRNFKVALLFFCVVPRTSLAAATPDLTGSVWRSPCAADEDGGSVVTEISFTDNMLIALTNNYSDIACRVATESFGSNSTYTLGQDTKVEGAVSIDLTLTALTIAPGSDKIANLLNQARYCGYSDWAIGQAKDVTGNSCVGDSPKVGSQLFSILSVQIGADGKQILAFGDISRGKDGTSVELRPTTLDQGHGIRVK